MLRTWLSTVRSEMNRRAPICLLVSPSATSRATSASRFASGPAPAGPAGLHYPAGLHCPARHPSPRCSGPARPAGRRPGVALRLTECQSQPSIPVQALPGLETGLEPRLPERSEHRLLGLVQQRREERHEVGARLGPQGVRGAEQLRGAPGTAGQRRVAAERVEQVELRDPVVDLVREPQGLDEQRFCLRQVAGVQRGGTEVQQHDPLHVVVARFPGAADPFRSGGPRRSLVTGEERMQRLGLEHADPRGRIMVHRPGRQIGLADQHPG